MSKRGFVRSVRQPPPAVPPVRVAVAPPLALPEREPRNILLMIAVPALLVGIIGTLVVMYTSGVRSLQSGFFPMMGLVGFGALMFSGRFGRGGGSPGGSRRSSAVFTCASSTRTAMRCSGPHRNSAAASFSSTATRRHWTP
jgi:hypothetical protein